VIGWIVASASLIFAAYVCWLIEHQSKQWRAREASLLARLEATRDREWAEIGRRCDAEVEARHELAMSRQWLADSRYWLSKAVEVSR
jgi:hypothetical protein